MNKLIYPFSFEEWKSHKSTKEKLKWCKKIGDKIDIEIKCKQIKINFE